MPPKRPVKRRGGDEEDGGRPNKRPGKGKKVPTYDTNDEALDGTSSRVSWDLRLTRVGGVEMEEKGERYRDGEKVSTGPRVEMILGDGGRGLRSRLYGSMIERSSCTRKLWATAIPTMRLTTGTSSFMSGLSRFLLS
jgi:hypothetical protein